MGRTLNQILADLPPERQGRIDARYRELRQEVASLAEIRRLAGWLQADVANALNVKQPSVSKIEKQGDMVLSTLRSYVEAIGGELELTVKFAKGPALQLLHFDDASQPPAKPVARPARRRIPGKRIR